MTMLEKMAKGICLSFCGGDQDWADRAFLRMPELYLGLAKGGLRELREPTEAIRRAAMGEVETDIHGSTSGYEDAWRAQIDAIMEGRA